jgi:hypothetical protein
MQRSCSLYLVLDCILLSVRIFSSHQGFFSPHVQILSLRQVDIVPWPAPAPISRNSSLQCNMIVFGLYLVNCADFSSDQGSFPTHMQILSLHRVDIVPGPAPSPISRQSMFSCTDVGFGVPRFYACNTARPNRHDTSVMRMAGTATHKVTRFIKSTV